jgi:phosphopantothenoylcysteine decarboxylase/phosphopantothenate--cysteine ligase
MKLTGKKIVLVITGGIAAYKAAELARLIIKEGGLVRTAMTRSAVEFITPLTMRTLTGAPVAVDMWQAETTNVDHISLADWAEAVVIAPATANTIGKMANGIADDFVSTFLLAVKAPILVCPSMNVNMYDHAAVKDNLSRLVNRGVKIAEPGSGYLACGWEGKGRLLEPTEILEEIKALLSPQDLQGMNALVTAGPTREPWDDIRFISNRSTGQMGLALAKTARRRGARVTLVCGPVTFDPPYGMETVKVESTVDMLEALRERLADADVLVKAAAPGDFRPAGRIKGKIKKTSDPPPLELGRNPDILSTLAKNKGRTLFVGFAAESENLIENAKDKLTRKQLDLIVANQIGPPDESFGAATNRVWIIGQQGEVEEIPLSAKESVADRIWDRIASLRTSS